MSRNAKVATLIVVVVVFLFLLAGCSSFDGQLGKEVHEFEDEQGRQCTAIKWGESASVDCDYPPK